MPSFCLPIGDFLKSNHIFLLATNDSDYEFLREENQCYRSSIREAYIANFDLFARICSTGDTDAPLPKPQPLCDSLNHHELLQVADETDYEIQIGENQSYHCSLHDGYIVNFDFFRKMCTANTDIPLPKPQPLCESFNHRAFVSQLRTSVSTTAFGFWIIPSMNSLVFELFIASIEKSVNDSFIIMFKLN